MTQPVIIGNATLYLGDCREILPTLPRVDAVITDPPYGINRDGKRKCTRHRGYEFRGWDTERPDADIFRAIINAADRHVIWGGNYFADMLPATSKWLVWDKGQRIDQADAELAWTSMPGALRIFLCGRHVLNLDGAEHPTQKPIALMSWCIEQAGRPASIVDPFLGSGSTGVASAQVGASFIGIEREPKYFDIACRRIEDAQRQQRMFA